MRVQTTLVGWCLALTSLLAHADTDYTLSTPTALPYTRIDGHAAPGSFTDTVSFALDSTYAGYVWLFPRQDWLFSGLDNIQDASLTLRNDSTGDTWKPTRRSAKLHCARRSKKPAGRWSSSACSASTSIPRRAMA